MFLGLSGQAMLLGSLVYLVFLTVCNCSLLNECFPEFDIIQVFHFDNPLLLLDRSRVK